MISEAVTVPVRIDAATRRISAQWNLDRAITTLRAVEPIPDELLTHLSPLGWEHVNLTGDYVWAEAGEVTENHDGFRPLRAVPDPGRLAA